MNARLNGLVWRKRGDGRVQYYDFQRPETGMKYVRNRILDAGRDPKEYVVTMDIGGKTVEKTIAQFTAWAEKQNASNGAAPRKGRGPKKSRKGGRAKAEEVATEA